MLFPYVTLFRSKDFRTWGGTVQAARALREFESFDTKAAGKRNVTRAIERVAARLGNTPAVCRKCYVHPEFVESYLAGSLVEQIRQRIEDTLSSSFEGLSAKEAAVLAFLRQRLEQPETGGGRAA